MSLQPYPLTFQPVFKTRIWGGSRLSGWFAECPAGEPVGEAWVLSDHPEGTTAIANGPLAGQALHDTIQRWPDWFGRPSYTRFPLLVKVIDAAADLSIQVHPDDTYGMVHNNEQGKTECWWVLDAAPDAALVYGHTAQTRAMFERLVQEGNWTALLQRAHPSVGDFYYVPAGKVHALGRGTMVLEIQQSSDTTYRVHDYDRLDATGQPRRLHLDDALNVIHYPDVDVPVQRQPLKPPLTGEKLVVGPYFSVEKWSVSPRMNFVVHHVTILSVIAGSGRLSGGGHDMLLHRGQQVLLPLGMGELAMEGPLEVLVTQVP